MTEPAINLDQLRTLLNNDQDGIAEIIREFLIDIPESLVEMRNMFEAGEWKRSKGRYIA